MSITNEMRVAQAFSSQASIFDQYEQTNAIIKYKRRRVRDKVLDMVNPGSSILELNAGTGNDSIFLGACGYHVHATDIAPGMLTVLSEKVSQQGLNDCVTYENCSFTKLNQLKHKGPYDLIFSNLAGLNCTEDLKNVLHALPALLKPGGQVLLVILPRFCLWETLLLFKGKFRTAFRRFRSRNGVLSKVEGQYFRCWYYPPSFVKKHTFPCFELTGLEGLCVFVPPSYLENFAERHLQLFGMLCRLEELLKGLWPWNRIGDYFIISFRKRPGK